MSESLIKVFKEKILSGLGKDILFTLGSQVAIMILALVVNKLLSNMLGVDGYGQYGIIKKSSAVLSFVMLGGMGIALPRYFSSYIARKEPENAKSTVVASLLVILLVSAIVITACILLINRLSPLVVGSSDTVLYFAAILYAFSITLSSLLYAYYRGANEFKNFAVSQVMIQVLITVCTILFGGNLQLVLFLWSFSAIIYVLFSIIFERKTNNLYINNPVNWNNSVSFVTKVLLKYGMPRMVGDFFLFSFAAFTLIFINEKIDLRSSSFFAAGLTLTSLITPFFSYTGMVLLPYVSKSIAENTFRQSDKIVNRLFFLNLAISVLAIIVLWFGMDFFIRLFFSSEFLPAVEVSKILMVSILFESVYFLLRNPIDAASVFPYNTINLLISLVALIVAFSFSNTLIDFAMAYLAATALKALLTMFSWFLCRNRLLHEQINS